jgi:hypothetical protein
VIRVRRHSKHGHVFQSGDYQWSEEELAEHEQQEAEALQRTKKKH